ncbi:WhiB family transcriptional regulator [Corynebacterium flavescens]|uniref:WhiB family transcriptional regulator n=1 Tax=Corynebacterium flavescens TaxID=28028 RepID=UPI003FCF1452
MEGALCSGRVSEFDPFRGGSESPEAYRERMTAARALCDQCPAREACLALGNALPAHTRAGVWGGRFYPEYESPSRAAQRHRRNLRNRKRV